MLATCVNARMHLAGCNCEAVASVAQQLPDQTLRLRLDADVRRKLQIRSPLNNFAAGSVGVVAEKGRETTKHFKQHAANAPKISLWAISHLAKDFRRNVIRRPDGGIRERTALEVPRRLHGSRWTWSRGGRCL